MTEYALQAAFAVEMKIPQTTVMPVTEVLPVGAVDDRVKTNPFYRNSRPTSNENLGNDFARPTRAPAAKMTGLCNEDRSAIASINIGQQMPKRKPPFVSRRVLPAQPVFRHIARILPLICVIVV